MMPIYERGACVRALAALGLALLAAPLMAVAAVWMAFEELP